MPEIEKDNEPMTAKTEVRYYHVETPQTSMTWIGGSIEPAGVGGDVWLCSPTGRRILRVPGRYVKETTRQETARRIVEGRLFIKSRN